MSYVVSFYLNGNYIFTLPEEFDDKEAARKAGREYVQCHPQYRFAIEM